MASSSDAAAPSAHPNTAAEHVSNVEVEPSFRVEAYQGDDQDSAYDSELASYTTSLASDVTDFKFENGRRYHAYKEGSYLLPNDENENDRLDMTHKMLEVCLGGKLFLAPLKEETCKRALDIGTGTGIWAIEFADQFPKADVLGNDLSPIQPRWVPPNVHFEVDDVEADWTYSQKFDFIHCRLMAYSIKNWARLARQAFEHTAPGGYSEFQDCDLEWLSPDGSYENSDHLGPVRKVNATFVDTTKQGGLDPSPGRSLHKWLTDAGFEDVTTKKYVLPVGSWPADKHLKEVGVWNYMQINEGIDGILMAVYTRLLNYTEDEVRVLASQYRKQLKDPRMHALLHFYVTYGKKPADKAAEAEHAQGHSAPATTETTA